MFDERILILLKSDSFYLPSVKTPKTGGESIKKTGIRREMTGVPVFRPFFQRNGWTLWGRGSNIHLTRMPMFLKINSGALPPCFF